MARNTFYFLMPLVLLFLVLRPMPGKAQPTVKSNGVYAYNWKGVPHTELDVNCDSVNNPDLYFTSLPLFFFYADNSAALASDDNFHAGNRNALDADYFVRNETRLSKKFQKAYSRGGASSTGMFRTNGPNEVIAKLRESEYSWNYFKVYYHFVSRGSDTLWLTQIVRTGVNAYRCLPTGKQFHVISFSPALPFVFYPTFAKPDSSKGDVNKKRWVRKW